MRPPMAPSEAQKPNNSPNGSASTSTTNVRRKVLMEFSSLHPCSASMDDDDEDNSIQSSQEHTESSPGMHPISHSHSHPLSSSSSSSTPTQMQTRSVDHANRNYAKGPEHESTPTTTAPSITARFRSKSKSKATTAHVHFLDEEINEPAPYTITNGNRSTKADMNTTEERTTLGPRSRDLSLSESEISLLDLGPSLVYGDDGYIPLSGGRFGHGQGGGVSVVGRGGAGFTPGVRE
ncbi:hypothetical protein AnigIFM59636_000082 [Aspergillus niger]|nr:hypothetical protein M747DRAFT_327698 [Aspergillus niger ATCC 13496]GKZ67383.1 hypothetical protein AnigIFM50267_001771 [Aspergillus niger]GKZ86959.1 hypothetical protein AnigIFM59636_000082 [Aspergillus niger]